MNRSVTCYYAKGGQGKRVIPAFAEGCCGVVQKEGPYRPGVAAIYGVKPRTAAIWRDIQRHPYRWFYIDNAYFGRGTYFRVTEGAIQCSGTGRAAGDDRFYRLGVRLRPWQTSGRHVLVCAQSDNFMANTCGVDPQAWAQDVRRRLSAHTDRPILWRDKFSTRPFELDLMGAHAVVTHTSNCAVEAICAGVPAFVTGPSAARPVSAGDLEDIESPLKPDGREAWVRVLAANQWSLDEFRNGTAWRELNASGA